MNKYQLVAKLYNYWRDGKILKSRLKEAFPSQEKEFRALVEEGIIEETKMKVNNLADSGYHFESAIQWTKEGFRQAALSNLLETIEYDNLKIFSLVCVKSPSGNNWQYRDCVIIGNGHSYNYLFLPILYGTYHEGFIRLGKPASEIAHHIEAFSGISCNVVFGD